MLELANGKVILDPDLLTIPQFRTIWERDESPNKEQAHAYVAYIFNFYNPKSPFFNYVEEERHTKIIEKLFPESMKEVKLYEDKAFLQASDIYKNMLNLSPMRAVLEVVKVAMHEISNTLKSSKEETSTKLAQMPKLTKAFEEYKKMEKLIDEDEINSNVKGARSVRKRER